MPQLPKPSIMKTFLQRMLVWGGVLSATVPGYGAALQFDGTNDYIAAGATNLANSSFTVEAWARRLSASTVDIVLGQGYGATDQGLHFGFHCMSTVSNKFVFGFYYDDLFTTNRYTDDDWHHWAGTYDALQRHAASIGMGS